MGLFGLKYKLLCNTRKKNLYTVRIYFDGYSGVEINRNVPISPFKLKKDKAAVIRGTSFEFSMCEQVDFEFLDFYTNNSKSIKVELYPPEDETGFHIPVWSGFVLPQQYQVPYIPPPATVTFTATDGLGLLKTEKFDLTGRNTQLEIISFCINKIGLALGFSIAITLFEVNHDQSRSPLEQTYEDSEAFFNNNCYEVLEKILGKYDAEITQRGNRWAITRSADKKSARMLYTSAGTYESAETGTAIITLGQKDKSGTEVWPRGQLSMSLHPGGKQVKIIQDFGLKSSVLSNWDFKFYANDMFPGWQKSGSFNTLQGVDKDGNTLAFLTGYSNVDTDYIYQEVNVINKEGDNFIFEIDFSPRGVSDYRARNMTVRILVLMVVDSVFYFLSETGWVNTTTIIEKTVLSTIFDTPEFNKLKIITSELPGSGLLHVRLYRYKSGTQHPGDSIGGVRFSNVMAYFLNAGAPYPGGAETLAVFTNSSEPLTLPDSVLGATDAPDVANAHVAYNNITRLSDGAPTKSWISENSAAELSLMQQLALTLASNNRVARQKLTGTIKGSVPIAFDSIIKHPYNNNREFEIAEGTWDIYEETFNIVLIELLPWNDEPVIFTEAITNGSGSGSSTGVNTGSGVIIMTGEQILAKLLAVDGDGSLLDADLLDGQHAAYFAAADHAHVGVYEAVGVAHQEATDHIAAHLTAFIHDNIAHGEIAYNWGYHGNFGYITSETSHVNVVVDGDFTSNGILKRTAAGVYAVGADNSANWDTAFSWGNHAGLYRPSSWMPTYSELGAAAASHSHAGLYDPIGTGHTEASAHVLAHETTYNHSNFAPLANPRFTGEARVIGPNAQFYVGKYVSSGLLFMGSSGPTHYNWLIAEQYNEDQAIEFTPSTVVGGSSYTTPAATFARNGNITAGNFLLSSDERLKRNIRGIQMDPVDVHYTEFEMKSDPGKKRYGVIAQELHLSHPELVNEDTKGFLSVKYIDLLVREVAYLKNKVDNLERRLP